MPELLYFVFLPFISVFAVIFGLLSQIFVKTFPKKVNVVLALVFALSLLYTGPLMALVGVLFQVGSIFGVIVFFIMFVVLTLLLLYRRTGESYIEAKKIHEQYKDIAKQSKKLAKDLEKIGNEFKDIEEKINRKKADLLGLEQLINRVSGQSSLPRHVWFTVKDETRRLTGSTPSSTPHAQGLLTTKRARIRVEIEDLEKKRDKLRKDQQKIEDKLRA